MTSIIDYLPGDWRDALLLGRLQRPEGPSPILVRNGRVFDVSRTAPTSADIIAAGGFAEMSGEDLGLLEDFDFDVSWDAATGGSKLLSPIDLQCVKASGVTFAVSARTC